MMGKKLFTACAVAMVGTTVAADALTDPPRACYPETWFHFQGANITREGITADFDALAQAGFSGVQVFHGMELPLWPGVTNPVVCLSDEWRNVVRFAADEAKVKGLSFAMQNCPGWAQSGGPWIKPEDAQRTLTMTRTDVISDGTKSAWTLPLPEMMPCYRSDMPKDFDYRDIAVIAFPTPDHDTDEPLAIRDLPAIPAAVSTGEHVFEFGFAGQEIVRTVELPAIGSMVGGWCYHPSCGIKVEAKMSDGTWTTIAETEMKATNFQDLDESRLYVQPYETKRFAIATDEVWTDRVRLTLANPVHGLTLQNSTWGVKEFVRIYSGARIDDWRGQAGWSLHALPRRKTPVQNKESWISLTSVRILPGGSCVTTTLPSGKWTLLRIGHQNAMRVNAPAPTAATGWECNKLDVRGARASFDGYIGKLLDEGRLEGRLQKMIIDSWECGSQLWTDRLDDVFRKRYGYDLRPFLPALFGFVVDQVGRTESVLTDWRRLLGELVTENYYGELGRLARARGLSFDFETAFGDIVPGDVLSYYRHADTPMCEFWSPRGTASCGSDRFKPFRPTVSAARIYGKNRVAAEAFTGNPLWKERLRDLKHLANRAFIRGVSHLVFHTYPHQPFPKDMKGPGAAFGGSIGSGFMRGQTWWPYMPEFTKYVARIGAVMESCQPVSDILWLLPDDMDQRPDELATLVPPDYAYDFLNSDVLLNRLTLTADGRFTTPEGLSWRMIVMPTVGRMRPEVAAKIFDLRKKGGLVFLGDAMKTDFATAIAEEIRPAVVADGWKWSEMKRLNQVVYLFTDDDGKAGKKTVSVRDGIPHGFWERYYPVDGRREPLQIRWREDGRTEFDLTLDENELAVVVCSSMDAPRPSEVPQWHSDVIRKQALPSGWILTFPAGWTEKPDYALERLVPWRKIPKADQATRAFSGTAVYRRRVVFDRPKTGRLVLDLGKVNACATVKVNGQTAGKLWCAPYRLEIGNFVKEGSNELEISVTDSWRNRLGYDAGLPEADRRTWVFKFKEKNIEPTEDSGLLGPVTLFFY